MGSRLTRGAESIWQGNLQDIYVGMFIATTIEGNGLGNPFWIGKVLEVIMHENQNKLKSLNFYWYSIRCKNAFTYTLEMIEVSTATGKRKRKKDVQSTSLLDLDDVDVLV